MKKFMLLALVVMGLATFASPVSAVAKGHHNPKAHTAAVQVGPCVLHAYTPSKQAGGLAAHGRVDTCGGITGEAHIKLQVCLQVQGPGGYGQYTVSGTCTTTGPYNALSIDAWSNPNSGAVVGHVYRTWDWAQDNDSTGWYTSSWVTYYG